MARIPNTVSGEAYRLIHLTPFSGGSLLPALSRLYMITVTTQQTQNICIIFVQRRTNVFDVGPTLYICYTNVLCLLGSGLKPQTLNHIDQE